MISNAEFGMRNLELRDNGELSDFIPHSAFRIPNLFVFGGYHGTV
jgi:hypothetical protein